MKVYISKHLACCYLSEKVYPGMQSLQLRFSKLAIIMLSCEMYRPWPCLAELINLCFQTFSLGAPHLIQRCVM